jgi:hypothetical protein
MVTARWRKKKRKAEEFIVCDLFGQKVVMEGFPGLGLVRFSFMLQTQFLLLVFF